MTYNRFLGVRFEKERYQQLKELSSEMGVSTSDAIRGAVALLANRPELRALLNVEKGASDERESE